MCCSRVCMAMRRQGAPRLSTVTPMMRPDMRREYESFEAMKAACGPPYLRKRGKATKKIKEVRVGGGGGGRVWLKKKKKLAENRKIGRVQICEACEDDRGGYTHTLNTVPA